MLPSGVGDGALSAVDTREFVVRFHSPGFRDANVTAITGVARGWGTILTCAGSDVGQHPTRGVTILILCSDPVVARRSSYFGHVTTRTATISIFGANSYLIEGGARPAG